MSTSKKQEASIRPYQGAAGGWGALASSGKFLLKHGLKKGVITLKKANQADGFDCPGCAWPDPLHGSSFEFCENGVKAVTSEATWKRADQSVFSRYTLNELRTQSDFELEDHGRLTEPLRYDAATNRYLPISWDEAFSLAGETLRALDPHKVSFYTSGRSSNEAAFLWQLMVRRYGSNNLPDSSNLCHEPSGVGLREVIGVGKGTARLEDFALAEAIFVIGQNPGTNHPRMLGELHRAHQRGATIVSVNPLKERGLERFTDPKRPSEMLTGGAETISDHYFQVKIGGDLAFLKGMMRVLIEADDAARAGGRDRVLDHAFIAEHTSGFAALREDILAESWDRIEAESGLSRAHIERAAQIYMHSNATLITWCMGITHHEYAVATIQTIVNLLLLKGNIGKPGAGAVPVRGHSNVQGDRTQGITVKPSPAWLANLQREFGFTPPAEPGLDAVATAEALIRGELQGFLSLGGNFAAAAPDSPRICEGMSRAHLTVHIATKLNRSHLYPGSVGLILPCLGRTEIDMRKGQAQFVSVEDSMSMVHQSAGINLPASPQLMSEPAIIAHLAHAAVGDAHVPWLALADDYDAIRTRIESCQQGVFPGFEQFNERIRVPRGFWLPNMAALRKWQTASGKAEFRVHPIPLDTPIHRARARAGDQVLALMSIRSHDQYNTTIYGMDDRYRGVFGGREVIFISAADLARLGFVDGQMVDLHAVTEDGVPRSVQGFRLVQYDIPQGCIAGYFPEVTPLAETSLKAKGANTPASKEIPVRIVAAGQG
ncbi:FdhF/YdeP family oxidoreductase [Burkholderiaceae bacterium DAT-1]|nr:FdhF/YdeP family oxidoreductase [Burkholderiaceae bacterium DAT-1]